MSGRSQPQVVYIAGYGRSGSTVLDIILGNHPDVFGAGELNMLLPDLAGDGACSCGQPYRDCDVWKPVLAEAERAFPRLSDSTFVGDIYRSEATSGLWARGGERCRVNRLAGDFWRQLYQLVGNSTDSPIIVDSSKTARFSSRRIRRLASEAGLDVKVLHLTRDPRAVAYSEQRRGNNDRLESGWGGAGFGGSIRPIIGWVMANLAVDVHRLRLRGLPVLHVRYEDLASNSAETVTAIADFLALDPKPLLARIDSGAGFDPGHGVRGNRLRRKPTDGGSAGPEAIQLRYDTDWLDNVDRPLRLVALIAAPLARRYGYQLTRLSSGRAAN